MSYSKGFVRNKQMIYDSDKQKQYSHDLQDPTKQTPKSRLLTKWTQNETLNRFSDNSTKATGIDSVKISTPQQQSQSKFSSYMNNKKNYGLKLNQQYRGQYESKKQDDRKVSANRTLYNLTYKKYLAKQSQIGHSTQDHEITFQSAKIQSLKCLQNLQKTLQQEISSIDSKLENFHYKMNRSIMSQFQKLRDRIIDSIDKIFKENDKNIQKYMKIQEEILAGELIQMKQHLKQEHTKIEKMKENLKGVGWRKVAGQIIASDITSKITSLTKQAQNLEVGYWEPIEISDNKLKPIENQIRQLAKLAQ